MEFNKLAASLFVAGIIALLSGMLADGLYNPVTEVAGNKSTDLANAETTTQTLAKEEEKIDIKILMASANYESGKNVAKKCAACHNFTKGAGSKIGPDLWNIVGKTKASADGFSYSKSLSELGGKWDYDSLASFLHNPKSYAKGTKMAFAGLRKQSELADVIEFLRQSSDNPLPKP